jgi:hypothetical protein
MTFGTPAPLPQPTIATVLSGEGQRGTHITVSEGAAITDTAVITAPGGQPVTGRVTYAAYPSASCSGSAITGLGGGTTTGTGPATNPVTLEAGTYYFQAFYSGSPSLRSASTRCGDEVLTVVSRSLASGAQTSSSPPPNASFSLVGSPHVNGKNGQIMVTAQFPGAGTASAEAVVQHGATLAALARGGAHTPRKKGCNRGLVRAHGKCMRNARVLYGAASLAVPVAGTYTIVIKPTTRVLTALRRGKQLAVTLSITFQARSGGTPVTRIQSVVVRLKEAHRRH